MDFVKTTYSVSNTISNKNINYDYYKEKLVHIYYEFTRSNGEPDLQRSAELYRNILCSLKYDLVHTHPSTYQGNPHVLHFGMSDYNIQNHMDILPIIKLLYKLIMQTRDICYGKGERDLTYMMIYEWWKQFPVMGLIALRSILFSPEINVLENDNETNTYTPFSLYSDDNTNTPANSNNNKNILPQNIKIHIDTNAKYVPYVNSYGCFKDVKYFCNYVKKYGDENDVIITYATTFLNQQLYDDYMEFQKNGSFSSIACKWIPRENSKYGWLFEKMAIQWANATMPYLLKSINIEQYENMLVSFDNIRAIKKCKMQYRKIVSMLSTIADIPEIKKCKNRWSEIDPTKITIDNMFRNNNALFNIDNMCNDRHDTVLNKDRRLCMQNMKEHLFISEMSPDFQLEKLQKSYMNQYTFSPMQFVKQAMKLIAIKTNDISANMSQNIMYQKDLLNKKWQTFIKKCNALDYFIPIVDMSLSMQGDALYNAIGMSCLVAEKSRIGYRIMVMDNIPTWVNLEHCSGNFVEMVETLYKYANTRTIANIMKTFDTIIHAISMTLNNNNGCKNTAEYCDNIFSKEINENNKEKNEIIKSKLVFMIFTNEESFWKYENEVIHPIIVSRFKTANLNIPHIVYWNCSKSKNDIPKYPCSPFTEKTSLVSGTNAELLNHFSFIGWGNLYNSNSYNIVENNLNSHRYDAVDIIFDKYFYKSVFGRKM